MIKFTIDGRVVEAEKGMTVLAVARAHKIRIPALCYHPALKSAGSCRLCAVEVIGETGQGKTMLSCIIRAKEGLVVRTTGELVEKARTLAFQRLLQMAPQSVRLRALADEYGISPGSSEVRPEPLPDGCIRCRLCIRVCKEVVGVEALKIEKRDGTPFVVPVANRCIGCGTCANLCPTDAIRLEDNAGIRTLMIRDEVIGQHPLERCERCGQHYATPEFLHYVEERTARLPHVRAQHHYCPTCARQQMSDRSPVPPGILSKLN
ncbi:2Fe-2S ferredoxin [Desulfonema ishimotonii]|uniref:2Fe-2S ferredoxin n=1 Tax=Desulfonema ishimotonii TaxID=45657 RepID=A0A401FUX6_9BACT|nr:2Fe-2S iron-sulfur cluster-binding protein [Desulfonema ishimotonii]GBC60769.1 2Fe-2S ferredoxin [Desulfonema ishimotonii]